MAGPAIADESTECPHCTQPLIPPAAERCHACHELLLVADRYRVRSLLGLGGTSRVFAGLDKLEGSPVAIKVVRVNDARDWKTLDLFERGTQILGSLRHAAVPRVLAFVKDGARYYQVREYYAAGSLESLVRSGMRLDRKQVHFLLRDLLQVLDYLHARIPPVIHRDVKPANIMFHDAQELRPALVDFDSSAAGGPEGTGTTIVISPGYTAPEQLAGDAQPASDLYSLGMTMLFVLTQRLPSELPRRAGRPDPGPVMAGLEPATRHVIDSLIQPDLGQRYSSARDALRELSGDFQPVLHTPSTAGRGGLLTQKLEVGGVSLFRLAVGILLGVLLGCLALIMALNGTLGATVHHSVLGQ